MLVSEFLVIAAVIYAAISVTKYLFRRIRLYITIKSLSKTEGVYVHIESILPFLLPKTSRMPAAVVSVWGRTYAVRIFNSISGAHTVHFASPKFVSVSVKAPGATKARIFGRRVTAVKLDSESAYFARTVILPEMTDTVCDETIMIFNPAPRELTYVTREKSSVRVAFSGDTLMGMRVFTRKTFANFIDRASRGFFT